MALKSNYWHDFRKTLEWCGLLKCKTFYEINLVSNFNDLVNKGNFTVDQIVLIRRFVEDVITVSSGVVVTETTTWRQKLSDIEALINSRIPK